MKKKDAGKISAGLIFCVFFGIFAMKAGGIGEVDVIKQRMMSLGFLDSKIDRQRDGSYSIWMNAYTQKTQSLSLDGAFRPFEVRAKYSREILYLEKTDIEKAGFSVDEDYLPRGVKIVRMGIAMRSMQRQKIMINSDLQRIERALEETKRNRKRVYANTRTVAHKANQSFSQAFPDVCKTPSTPGPIPIPYPNIAMTSDMAKGTKKVKTNADKAVAIKEASEYKMSESDEVGTKMAKLQKAYRNIIAKRELSAEENDAFKKELKAYLEQAALLSKTLDKYMEEIEKLLEDSKKEISIK